MARPLAEELIKRGVMVWYDDFTLTIGDSLRRSIDDGLAKSKFGIVILSRAFFNKEWPQTELDGLAVRQSMGHKVILPIWHEVTKQTYLAVRYRRLARRVGKKTALVAAGHSLLVIVYHVLERQISYKELGRDYFDKRNLEAQRKRLIKRLEATVLKVTVDEIENAA